MLATLLLLASMGIARVAAIPPPVKQQGHIVDFSVNTGCSGGAIGCQQRSVFFDDVLQKTCEQYEQCFFTTSIINQCIVVKVRISATGLHGATLNFIHDTCIGESKHFEWPEPISGTSVSASWILEGGSDYLYIKTPRQWTDAQADCRSLGRDLVTITSKEQNDQIQTSISTNWSGGFFTWIGLRDIGTTGGYRWVSDNSTPWSIFNNFAWPPAKGMCAHFRSDFGRWRNDDCQDEHPYLCGPREEKPVDLVKIQGNDHNAVVAANDMGLDPAKVAFSEGDDQAVWYYDSKSTCVAKGYKFDACDNSVVVCAANTWYGSYEAQFRSVYEASRQTSGAHPSCPDCAFMLPQNRCCDNTQIPAGQDCCGGSPVPYGKKCCGTSIIQVAQGCCNGVPLAEGTRCCGDTLIPEAQGCCDHTPLGDGETCCWSQVLPPGQECCARLPLGEDKRCCDDTQVPATWECCRSDGAADDCCGAVVLPAGAECCNDRPLKEGNYCCGLTQTPVGMACVDGRPATKLSDGSTLLFNPQREHWYDARDFCLEQGGDLLSIHTAEERDAALALAFPLAGDYVVSRFEHVWTAGTDRRVVYDMEDYLYWADGTGKLDNFLTITETRRGHRNCILLTEDGTAYGEMPSEYDMPSICRIPEIPSKLYISLQGYWERSRRYCQQTGGDLVSIHSEEGNRAVTRFAEQFPRSGFWIGGYKNKGKFEWVDGSGDFEHFEGFAAGQPGKRPPHDDEDVQDCVSFNFEKGRKVGWEDRYCDVAFQAICERGACSPIPTSSMSTNYGATLDDDVNSRIRFGESELPKYIDIAFDNPTKVCKLGIVTDWHAKIPSGRIAYSVDGSNFEVARQYNTTRTGQGPPSPPMLIDANIFDLPELRPLRKLRLYIDDAAQFPVLIFELKVWSSPPSAIYLPTSIPTPTPSPTPNPATEIYLTTSIPTPTPSPTPNPATESDCAIVNDKLKHEIVAAVVEQLKDAILESQQTIVADIQEAAASVSRMIASGSQAQAQAHAHMDDLNSAHD